MSRPVVNEHSECTATAEYFDDRKQPFVPAIVRYKVDDISDEDVINVVPYTTIAGAGTVSRVAITSTQNVMTGGRLRETRRVTFEVTAPGGGVTYPYADYDLARTNPQ